MKKTNTNRTRKPKFRFKVYFDKGDKGALQHCGGCKKKVYESEDAWLVHDNIEKADSDYEDTVCCSQHCADFWVLGHM